MADAIAIYRYVERSADTVLAFIEGLQPNERARLAAKIGALRTNGFVLLGTQVLTDTNEPHIKEIVVNGRVAIRMLACRGPVDGNKELTLLLGATERDNKYVPKNALEIAEARRQMVIANPNQRRVKHEYPRRAT